jgi:hypothetical protein
MLRPQIQLLDKVLMTGVRFQAAVEVLIFAFASILTLNFTQTPIKLRQSTQCNVKTALDSTPEMSYLLNIFLIALPAHSGP